MMIFFFVTEKRAQPKVRVENVYRMIYKCMGSCANVDDVKTLGSKVLAGVTLSTGYLFQWQLLIVKQNELPIRIENT